MIIPSIDGISAATREKTDAELMLEMSAGNADALEALFCRYVRLVYRVAVEILKDAGEAEDVTQEVFLEVYRRASLYDPDRGSVRVWLLQYAYHRTLRRKAALSKRAAYRSEPLDAADAAVHKERPRLTPAECRWVLQAGLAQLSERQRTTLELTCFEELTLRDVAERLGVSVGCTRHYYYRGLARLQEWARISNRHTVHVQSPPSHGEWEPGCHAASGAGKADGVTRRDPQLFVRL